MTSPKIGTQQEWASARAELLVRDEAPPEVTDRPPG